MKQSISARWTWQQMTLQVWSGFRREAKAVQSKGAVQMAARTRHESGSDQGWIQQAVPGHCSTSKLLLCREPWAPAAVRKAEHFSSAPPEVCLNKDASSRSFWSPARQVCVGPPFSMVAVSRRGQTVINMVNLISELIQRWHCSGFSYQRGML